MDVVIVRADLSTLEVEAVPEKLMDLYRGNKKR